MEKFREEKIRDNKKSVFIIGSIITIAILIIIGILSFKEKNNLANISSSMEEKKVTWQSDSQEKYLVDKISGTAAVPVQKSTISCVFFLTSTNSANKILSKEKRDWSL